MTYMFCLLENFWTDKREYLEKHPEIITLFIGGNNNRLRQVWINLEFFSIETYLLCLICGQTLRGYKNTSMHSIFFPRKYHSAFTFFKNSLFDKFSHNTFTTIAFFTFKEIIIKFSSKLFIYALKML